ncbi:MAG: hypothetical protein HZC44_12915 [Geobacter sp.]|nr:hypothetical protein [Geobacter sp.]
MNERKKDLLAVAALLVLLILFFAPILFTDKVIRAPDIINEFYWGVVDIYNGGLAKALSINLSSAGWDIYTNSGQTAEGGGASQQFLLHLKLLFALVPPPMSVSWCIVLHLFFGAAGIYAYCRLIGTSRAAAFLGGLVFAVAPENASLINAGHVMKIATISYAPWAFYFFEKGFRTRRAFFFLMTGLTLAFQFFNTHWQIAYYTCLAIAVYALIRLVAQLRRKEETPGALTRLVGLNLLVLVFFLTTVSIALFPLANWSKDTNRGAYSGANAGKGGLEREEAMSWSLPPEEVAAFAIPGLFGLSRQEGGENPTNIRAYYWGRMNFTQTVSYMGLLPWLLLPLPLLFRRDRYTWIALVAVVGGIVFSMGKYTPVYNFLFDYFPGINRFRVPKMMLFVSVMGLGVLAARALDCLRDPDLRRTPAFRRYVWGIAAVPLLLLTLVAAEAIGRSHWIAMFRELLAQPTRFEQGDFLVAQRWDNLVMETGIAAGVALLCCAAIAAFYRGLLSARILLLVLAGLFLMDVWRVDDKFMFTIKVPEHVRGVRTPVIEFLSSMPKEYRVLPMDGSDPMQFVSNKIPVMFTSNAVQQRRWQEFLDAFAFNSAMPDLINLKYLIYDPAKYQAEKGSLGERFAPVYQSPDGRQVVLENRNVLPKAWLVPSVVEVADPNQLLAMMQSPVFDPRRMALVESPPLLPMPPPAQAMQFSPGTVQLTGYAGDHITLTVSNGASALLVLGEKYYRGWKATDNGQQVEIVPVDHVLRGVYLPPGDHRLEFFFDPWPFKVGKYLTLSSFAIFIAFLGWELRRMIVQRRQGEG